MRRASASASSTCLNRLQSYRIGCRQYVFDDPGISLKPNVAFQKRRHRDFIGRIQRDRLGPARFGCLIGQAQTRKFFQVRRAEVQMTQVADRKAQIRLNPLRISQSIQDRQAAYPSPKTEQVCCHPQTRPWNGSWTADAR